MPNITCPYCNLYQDMRIAAIAEEPNGTGFLRGLAFCRTCRNVVYFKTDEGRDIVREQYPSSKVRQAPSELPDNVKKSYQEALVCFAVDAPNGALLMCRRAMVDALIGLGAPSKGDLPTQLKALVDSHKLTPDLKDWADHARIGGKLAGHGTGGDEWGDPSKIWGEQADAEAVIEFCDAFFEYIYVLPKRNADRRSRTGTTPASPRAPGSNAP
ncbi:MAG: DUF4145 domain-containing protein [Chloroflexi bacterium]|nr:DUF4145 domain-containing protein [Chloroflexota bacterium]